MNNDNKTTLFGFIRSALITLLAGLAYFGGTPLDSQITSVESSGDWGALILAVIAIVSFVVDYFTNKPDKSAN
jgi:hypothetical protein